MLVEISIFDATHVGLFSIAFEIDTVESLQGRFTVEQWASWVEKKFDDMRSQHSTTYRQAESTATPISSV